MIQYTLNTSSTTAKLYLFLNEDWKEVSETTECQQKLDKARAVCKCYKYIQGGFNFSPDG